MIWRQEWKFADGVKLECAVDSLKGQETLQRDLDRLEHWAIIHGMKQQEQTLAWRNTFHKYELGVAWLESSPTGKDLGSRLKAGSIQVSRGKPISGCTKYTTTSWWKRVIAPLYLALVQSHLDYCVSQNLTRMWGSCVGMVKKLLPTERI